MRIDAAEVETNGGIYKRETAASSQDPEEWPKIFICHGAGVNLRSADEVGDRLPCITTDRGFINHVIANFQLPLGWPKRFQIGNRQLAFDNVGCSFRGRKMVS